VKSGISGHIQANVLWTQQINFIYLLELCGALVCLYVGLFAKEQEGTLRPIRRNKLILCVCVFVCARTCPDPFKKYMAILTKL
jgi:hypothetical protein